MMSCIPLKPSVVDKTAIGPGCLFKIFPKKNGRIRNSDKSKIFQLLEMNYCVSENDDRKIKLVFYPNYYFIEKDQLPEGCGIIVDGN